MKLKNKMKYKINWKKGLLKCAYQLSSNGVRIGRLVDREWSRSAIGELGGQTFRFQTRGWIPKTYVMEESTNKLIATIHYNCWWPKATIQLAEQTYAWKFTNLFETRWKVSDRQRTLLKFSGIATRGTIHLDQQNHLLLLAGLFISSYYWRIGLSVILSTSIFPLMLLI